MFHNTEAISHKNTENFVRILGFKTGSKEGYPYKGGWVLVSIPSYARSISVLFGVRVDYFYASVSIPSYARSISVPKGVS